MRWFAVAFGLFQISQLSSGTPRPPHGIVPASYVTIAFLGMGNALIWRLSGRTQNARALR